MSIGALARWSRAGIDEYTVQVGKVLCSGIILSPETQEYVVKRIHDLRAIGYVDNTLWIGFGVKQILVDLIETEQGLSLITLCSALSVRYKDIYGAKVLRALCSHAQPPEALRPSFAKWKALVGLFAGILSASIFEHRMTGILRLLRAQDQQTKLKIDQPTIGPESLAAAIIKLASFSRDQTVNLDFTGAEDICWLAAFAEWALALDASIYDVSGSICYRSRQQATGGPQASFHLQRNGSTSNTLVIRGMNLIDDAQSLVQSVKRGPEYTLLKFSSSRTSILRDAFGSDLDRLLPPVDDSPADKVHTHFAFLLNHMYERPKPVTGTPGPIRESPERHVRRYSSFHIPFMNEPEPYRGLATVKQLLPELEPLVYTDLHSQHLAEHPPGFFGGHRYSVENCLLDAEIHLRQACCVADMKSKRLTFLPAFKEHTCLLRIVYAICHYVHTLRFMKIDESTSLSVHGLLGFYWEYFDPNGEALSFIFQLMTGEPAPRAHVSEAVAYAANGICISLESLRSPLLELTKLLQVNMTAGNIVYQGSRYDRIVDAGKPPNSGPQDSERRNILPTDIGSVNAKAIVGESDEGNALLLGYSMWPRLRPGSIPKSHMWVSLGRMFAEITGFTRDSNSCHLVHGKKPTSSLLAESACREELHRHYDKLLHRDRLCLRILIRCNGNKARKTNPAADLIHLYGEPAMLWLLRENFSATDFVSQALASVITGNASSEQFSVTQTGKFEKLYTSEMADSFSERSSADIGICPMAKCYGCQLLLPPQSYAISRPILYTTSKAEAVVHKNSKGEVVRIRTIIVNPKSSM